MSNIAIKIENLGKSYLVGHNAAHAERYTALRDVIARNAKNLARKTRDMLAGRPIVQGDEVEEFWALKDVNLEIKQGDRVGIIGRNGAGKSTLLKILSRITEPTTGRVAINGRVASLLEVGTGFHPELTGRENISLNGAILGMSRKEIQRKFDEIVAFAEVEKFLDTPVKRYSSGMYVRLAFSVAAHLEPEILIVDEVLAVGDAQFQSKCLGKMEDVSRHGRTVLFVSHNINAIERLCSSAIVLSQGRLASCSSDVQTAIHSYLSGDLGYENMAVWKNSGGEFENRWFKPLSCMVSNGDSNELRMAVSNDSDIWVEICAEVREPDPALTVGYALYGEAGELLYWTYQTDIGEEKKISLRPGIRRLRSRIPKRWLNEGTYRIELIGGLHCRQWLFEPCVNAPQVFFEIRGGLSDSPYWIAKRPGALAPVMTWEID